MPASKITPATQNQDREVAQRAHQLFTFLRELQQLKEKPVRRVETYARDGEVIWFHSLPDHAAVAVPGRSDHTTDDGVWLALDRVPPTRPPAPPGQIARRVQLPSGHDLDTEPGLRPDRDAEMGWDEERMERIPAPDPGVAIFDEWLAKTWKPWHEQERCNALARGHYQQLFRMADRLEAATEEVELVLGIGHLSWHPEGHEPVARHVLALPASIDFNERSGRLTVTAGSEPGTVEVDMLDPRSQPSDERVDALGLVAGEVNDPFAQDVIGPVLQQAANIIDPDGRSTADPRPTPPSDYAVIDHAPALILRRRSRAPMLKVLAGIAADIKSTGVVPAGIRQLVDISAQVVNEVPTDPADVHLPLAANAEQLQIIDRVEQRPFTVVQGPPGTGKTHTIANLMSHLLARGKRVLVTAETDRALHELRDKLPTQLQPLCVSVVGRDRADRNALGTAIDELSRRAERYRPDAERARTAELGTQLRPLRQTQTDLHDQLVNVRAQQTQQYTQNGYQGTLAEIARTCLADETRYGWLTEFVDPDHTAEPPLPDVDLQRLLVLLRDESIWQHELDARAQVPCVAWPTPEDFAQTVTAEQVAIARLSKCAIGQEHRSFATINGLILLQQKLLRDAISAVRAQLQVLQGRPEEAWLPRAVADVARGRTEQWDRRRVDLEGLMAQVDALLTTLPPQARVAFSGSTPMGVLRQQAEQLHQHVTSGGRIKGSIRVPRPVKAAANLLQEVRVNDLRPHTTDALKVVSVWIELFETLSAMDRLWPADVVIPQEDTPQQRASWHRGELVVLSMLQTMGGDRLRAAAVLDELRVHQPDWGDVGSLTALLGAVAAAAALETVQQAGRPLTELAKGIAHEQSTSARQWPLLPALTAAVTDRDPALFARTLADHHALVAVRDQIRETDRLLKKLNGSAPRLGAALKAAPHIPLWNQRCATFSAAWHWLGTRRWLAQVVDDQSTQLTAQLQQTERDLQQRTAELTSSLAWEHAVERLTPGMRTNLSSYAYAVKKIPKTRTAKTYMRTTTDAQNALRRCREAVPAWIMPLYRIAETLDVERDAFDVVIVDEASQAGVEAALLQYLAPKTVVVGDDKQVSPSGIGLKEDDVQRLRSKHLGDVPHDHVWASTDSSLFDIARVYFSDRVTLREHFRCVPEIIGFSNRVVYEPDRVPLIPVRQFGRDRLPPVQTSLVSNGYRRGMTNPLEAERVVELVTGFVADPAYTGKSIGVISLTGKLQARLIEEQLLERLDPTVYRSRELRCGDAADFQGSERDVIVLSMVAALDGSVRYAPLTRQDSVERYNVACSRAKDQLWVVHSISHDVLNNQEDLRYQLLSYCAETIANTHVPVLADRVTELQRVAPFSSIFHQQIYNALLGQGYPVTACYDIYGYPIDLVVEGRASKLAVTCDGDAWNGREQYQRELARQHDLQRCGWQFHRIRESRFVLDPEAVLAELWEALESAGVEPLGSEPEPASPFEVEVVLPPGIPDETIILDDTAGSEEEVLFPLQPPETAAVPIAPEIGQLYPTVEDAMVPESGVQEVVSAVSAGALEPHEEWVPHTTVASPERASTMARIVQLRSIVDVEGPILGERLFQQYIRAAGLRRLGKNLRADLVQAANEAERRDDLVGDDPLGGREPLGRTYRLPEQPAVRLRTLGSRSFLHVPPAELAAMLENVEEPLMTEEDHFRAVMRAYGMVRLTDSVLARLRACRKLGPGNHLS